MNTIGITSARRVSAYCLRDVPLVAMNAYPIVGTDTGPTGQP